MRFAVLGSPIAHSKSPAMHNAAFRALGLEHTYEAIDCDAEKFKELVAALKQGKFAGFSVTVPHKARVLELADEVAPSARIVGAANTLVRDASGKITAHNTDADALAHELTDLAGEHAAARERRTGVVLGNGGAARAAIAACAKLRCRRVVLACRSVTDSVVQEAERIMTDAAPNPLAVGTTSVVARPFGKRVPLVGETFAIVQATTCGMTGGPDGAIVRDALFWPDAPKRAVVLDVVYSPAETPFLVSARSAGLRSANGLGMLVRQGALAFELWLKIPAPFDVMRAAIDA